MEVYKPEDELSFNNREEVLKLPVAPQNDVEFSVAGQNESWNTTDVGSFKAIGHPGLLSVSIESFFPAQVYSFCTYREFPSPEACVAMIRKWQESKRPIRYIRTGQINEAFAIESFAWHKQPGTGDIYYKLDLEQYRFAERSESTTSKEVAVKKKWTYLFVTLVKGQTLCELAQKYLGDADRYKEIFELNKHTMKDVGHPWNYDLEKEGTKQEVKIKVSEGEPGYELAKTRAITRSAFSKLKGAKDGEADAG